MLKDLFARFRQEPKALMPGLLPDTLDPRDVYADEIVAGEATLPDSFDSGDRKYKRQGAYPFCVAFAICRAAEWFIKQETGQEVTFSEPHLFFNGGGGRGGSSVRALLDYALNQGFVLQEELPMPKDLGNQNAWDDLSSSARAIKPSGKWKIPGYVRVNPNSLDIGKNMVRYGVVLATVAAGRAYWQANKQKLPGEEYNHEVRWVAFKKGEWFAAMDHLQRDAAFDGLHTFAWDYEIVSVYAITKLPENWRDMRDQARVATVPNNAARYGKPRDFAAETAWASAMDKEFRAFKNQSVYEAAGKFWEVFIRAGVYGGYTMRDLINSTYQWRRTGKHAFDFDKTRY